MSDIQRQYLDQSYESQEPHKVTVPKPVQGKPRPTNDLNDLLALMARLRADCPWDMKQTNYSLIPYAIEESYELAEAVQSGDIEDIKGELGDVLLQVVFHCQLYAEQGLFDLGDVVNLLQEKLIRRHPHVFESDKLADEEAVKQRWDEIKAEEDAERESRGKPKRRLDKVKGGSALMQSQSIQKATSKMGFDWGGVEGALEKLEEEIAELKVAIKQKDEARSTEQEDKLHIELEKEMGDCFFGLVNVARKLNLDAEAATLTCVHKFKSRFGFIEAELAKRGLTPEQSTLDDMDALWDLAKKYE